MHGAEWTAALVKRRLAEAIASGQRPQTELSEALACLSEGERRVLAAYAAAVANGVDRRALCQAWGWPKSTFYRQLRDAACCVAAMLNARAVVIEIDVGEGLARGTPERRNTG